MTDPFDALPPDVAALIAEERGARDLAPATKTNVFMRLASIGLMPTPALPIPMPKADGPGEAPGNEGAAPGQGGAGLASKLLATKVGIAAVALVIGGLGGAALQATLEPIPSRHAPRMTVVPAASTDVGTVDVAGPSSQPEAASSAISVHALPSAARTAPPSGSPSTMVDMMREERASLEIARTAMTRGDFSGAAAAIDRHARDFPHGKLVEERESMRVQALVGQGRYEEARSRAARFRHDFPGSLLQGAVDSAVASIP